MIVVLVVVAVVGLATVLSGPFVSQMLQSLRELHLLLELVLWPGESILQSMAGPYHRHLVGNSFENITGSPGA